MIRPASSNDVLALASLHSESFGEAKWSVRQILDSLSLPTTQAWIVEEDGIARGFILCQFTEDEAEILTFCVNSAMRREGMGQKLLDALLSAAKQHNIPQIFLEVADDNQAALALYEKTGFRVIGKRKDYYPRPNGAVDAVMLELIL